MTETRFTRETFLARLALARLRNPLRLAQFEELPDLTALVERAEGDLSGLTADELSELRDQLAAAYQDARPAVETDEQVEALRTVAEAIARVDGETEARAAAAEAREAELAELDAAVEGDGNGEGSGEGSGEGEGGEGDGTGSGEGDGEGASGEGAEGGDGEGEGASGEGDGGEPTATGQQAAAATPVVPRRANLAVLRRSGTPGRQEPEGADDGGDHPGLELALRGRTVAAAALPELGRGEAFADADQLGQALARLASDLQVASPSGRKFYLGRTTLPKRDRVVLQADHRGEDVDLIDLATRRNLEAKLGNARRVASGGVCLPAQVDYSITTVGERGTPWLDRLPTIQGNRPMSYFPWIRMSLKDAAGSRVGARPDGGIGTVTAAQDAAGYGPEGHVPVGGHAYKDCVRIDCPTPVTISPEATFRCTTVGNFQAITWPEYVRTFDETVGFYFDVYRDERFLAKFVAAAKTLSTAGPTFGAARDLLDVIRRLAAHVRGVRRAPMMPLNFDLPAFARYMVAQDIAVSLANGSDNLRVSAEQALAILAVDEGIFIGEYDVSIGNTANGSPTVLPELTDGGALPAWPAEIRILAYPEGGVFRQDYGELSFGLRETGMQTNDFSGFYEVFEQEGFRTADLFTIDVPLCVNGAQGAAVAVTCE